MSIEIKMHIGRSSRVLAVTIIVLLILVNISTINYTYAALGKAKKMEPGKYVGKPKACLTCPTPRRTNIFEIQIERRASETAKPQYKIEYRPDLLSNVAKSIRELNTDLFSALVAKIIGVVPYIIS